MLTATVPAHRVLPNLVEHHNRDGVGRVVRARADVQSARIVTTTSRQLDYSIL